MLLPSSASSGPAHLASLFADESLGVPNTVIAWDEWFLELVEMGVSHSGNASLGRNNPPVDKILLTAVGIVVCSNIRSSLLPTDAACVFFQ